MADLALLERVLGPLREKILLMVTRAVVRRIHEGGGQIQVEGIAGEISDRVERWGVVGVASHPKPGTEALLAAVGGSRSHLVAVAGDDRERRPTNLAEGEIVVYAPDGSQATISLVDGKITIDASGDVVVNGGTVTIYSAQVDIGNGVLLALMNETLITWLDAHTHPGVGAPSSPVPPTTKTVALKAS